MSRVWMALRVIVAALAGLCAQAAHADELVVSYADPSVQVSGPWQTAATPGGDGSSEYLFRNPGAGGGTVFWPFPSSLAAGQYEVFARWVGGPTRATSATYWVAAADGSLAVTENQQANGAGWQSLGRFQFEPGKSHGITLTDNPTGVVVADALRWVGPLTSIATAGAADLPPPSAPAVADAVWTVALHATDLRAGPDPATDKLATVPQFAYLQVLGYQGAWAYVYNPRARGTAYAPADAVGPSDPPPAWVTAPPPTTAASVEVMGRTIGKAGLAYYPVDDKFAYTASLGHDVPVMLHERVQAPDGATWYRVDGGYLAASSVRLPRPPTRTFSGRWLDADLQEPAMLTAYDGARMVMNTLAIKGTIANQTPIGTFTILRRVQDETMDSGTLGVDPHGPGGYHLEHVLNTQYFTNDGASLHYNYWSSNFGYSGSHGCLGLDLQDSQFLWNWADIGTPVVIRS
ncbi:MAG: L,D-transpeptidase family protein [Chloroflexi bacterium]|nr:L,D-transpeptidase family protein [Chloroflexota bacterium]